VRLYAYPEGGGGTTTCGEGKVSVKRTNISLLVVADAGIGFGSSRLNPSSVFASGWKLNNIDSCLRSADGEGRWYWVA
jgi:hypothetical protein